MSVVNVLSSVGGFGIGNRFGEATNKIHEIQQGKNFYIPLPYHYDQAGLMGAMISGVSSFYPTSSYKWPVRIGVNLFPFVNLVAHLFFASVKHNHYETFAKVANQKWDNAKKISFIPLRFPENLGEKTVKVINFLAENSARMMHVGMIVGAVALIALGSPYTGGGILTALAYHTIDRMGFVPRKVSLFVETYLPTISLVGVLIGGTLIMRLTTVIRLSTHFSSTINRFLHQKVDLLVHRFWDKNGVTLEKIDAPVVRNTQLNFAQINEILDGNNCDFEINPAHCSKWVAGLDKFPVNNNFDRYLQLFDTVNWSKKYSLLQMSLQKDDMFMDFLKSKYPTIANEDLKKNFDAYVEKLATQEKSSKEDYVVKWSKAQLVLLVDGLKGKRRVVGEQKDLADAIGYCSKILAYLESLKKEDACEFEDVLLKLTIEGGNYCARGIKRAAGELTNNILQRGLAAQDINSAIADPILNYELKVARSLQDKRMAMIQHIYKEMMEMYKVSDVISDDVHGFDFYRIYLSLGMYPLTDYERKEVGVVQLAIWELYAPLRTGMYAEYQKMLNQAVLECSENGTADFWVYMNRFIQTNNSLSPEEKDILLDKCTDCNGGNWTQAETNHRFYRLMFVMLGVLNKKAK